MLRGFCFICCVIFLNVLVFGQDDTGVKFNITVKHKSNVYADALVKVYKSKSFLDQAKVDQQGEFTYLLPYGFVYQLHFTGEGMVTKIIELDLISNIPEFEKNTVHDWSIGEIELFKSYKEIDLTKLQEPIAKIHYESDMSEFSIDYKYTGKRKKELASVEAQVQKLEKKEAIVEKANKKEYEELVVKGNQSLNDRQYKTAQSYFEKAITLKPEGEAKQKLNAIKKVLYKEEQYTELLSNAKELVGKGDLQEASEKYIAASALKPEAVFPKQQIALISQKIKEEEKQANAFNNYMAVANRAYSSGDYSVAAANFNKALNINPDALLATKKLEISEIKIKEKETQEAADKQFDALFVQAKNARVRGDLEEAERFLAQAESVRPNDESLLKEKSSLVVLKEEEKKKEEAVAQLAIDQSFNKLIEEAKRARLQGDIEGAKQIINKAQAMKPDDDMLAIEKSAVASLVLEQKKKEDAIIQQKMAEEQEKEKRFANYLELAAKSEAEGNNKEALFFYKKAQGLKPNSSEVNAALAKLNKAPISPSSSSNKPVSTDSSADLDKMDKKSTEFQSKLATLYPEGKTVNNSTKGNKAITQVIIVKSGKGVEYQKIKYNWGGVYYFRNGDPISQLIFDKETQ